MLFVVSSWPVLKNWDTQLYPDDETQDRATMLRSEMITVRRLAVEGIGVNGGAFLATWWISPAVACWSEQPGVAGYLTEGMSGDRPDATINFS